MMLKLLWMSAATLAGLGMAAIVGTFTPDRFFNVGVAGLILGCMCACTGIVSTRSRSLDEEFDAGYRMGYRAGRRAGITQNVSPIRRVPGGFGTFNLHVKRGRHGRVSQAPVGAMAGDRATPGREASNAD